MLCLLVTLLFLSLAVPPASANLADYLGRWMMNENTGTTLLDQSPNNLDCTITGTATWSSAEKREGPTSARFGTGYDDYCTATADFTLNGDTVLSVGGWVSVTSPTAVQWIFAKATPTSTSWFTFYLRLDSTQHLQFGVDNHAQNTWASWLTTADLSDGWHHVAAAWARTSGTASDAVVYVDGSPVATTFAHTGYDNTFTLQDGSSGWIMGAYLPDKSEPLTGYLDDLRVFPRQLSASEVTDWYTGRADLTSNLLLKLAMDETSGTNVPDTSGGGHAFTVTNGDADEWVTTPCRGDTASKCVQLESARTEYLASASMALGLNGGAAVTFGGWFGGEGHPAAARTLLHKVVTGTVPTLNIWWDSDGTVGCQIGHDGGAPLAPYWWTPTPLAAGTQHHHIVCAFAVGSGATRADDMKLYIDGVAQVVGSNNLHDLTFTLSEGTSEMTVGTTAGSHLNPYEGTADDVRVWARQLSQTDVRAWLAEEQDITSTLPLRYWLTEGSGTTVTNTGSVGAELNGTFDGTNPPAWVTGTCPLTFPTCLHFGAAGASDDKVAIADDTAHSLNLSATPWTIAYWVQLANGDTGDARFFGSFHTESPYEGWDTGTVSGSLQFWNGSFSTTSTALYNDGLWHHVVWTHLGSGSTLRLFVDGVLVDTLGSMNTPVSWNGAGALGQLLGAGANEFSLQAVHLYRRQLTAPQIMALSLAPPPAAPATVRPRRMVILE